MALSEQQIRLRIRALTENLKQAMNVLEDLDLNENPGKTFSVIGDFASQAVKDAYNLAGSMAAQNVVVDQASAQAKVKKVVYVKPTEEDEKKIIEVREMLRELVKEYYAKDHAEFGAKFTSTPTGELLITVSISAPGAVCTGVIASYSAKCLPGVMREELARRLEFNK